MNFKIMDIVYVNKAREQISLQQMETLDKYYKQYYANGILMFEEIFLDGILHGLDYHNRNDNDHQLIINENFDLKYSEFNIIDHAIFSENLRLESIFAYGNEGVLIAKTNVLYDSNNNVIGSEMFFDGNGVTSSPDYNLTFKEYWDTNINPIDKLFECHFDSDTGSLIFINFENLHLDPGRQDSFSIEPGDIQGLIEKTGMSVQLANYYMIPDVIPDF